MDTEDKILKFIGLYSVDGPNIWFTHKLNKKKYLLDSALHPANASWNGSGEDGVVGTHYDNNGIRLNRSVFILVKNIGEIWREPASTHSDTYEAEDYELNENEHPLS